MKATELYNYRTCEYETVETFAKRVYDTAKRYRKSMIFNPRESNYVLVLLGKYYKESPYDILSVVRNLEYCNPSKKYNIQWIMCLGEGYLAATKR